MVCHRGHGDSEIGQTLSSLCAVWLKSLVSGEVEPEQLIAEAKLHLRGWQSGDAIRALVVFEAADRLFAAVHQQRPLPAKGQRLTAQGGAARRQPFEADLQPQHCMLELAEAAVARGPAHVAQPDIVLSQGAQLAVGIVALRNQREAPSGGERQVARAFTREGLAI